MGRRQESDRDQNVGFVGRRKLSAIGTQCCERPRFGNDRDWGRWGLSGLNAENQEGGHSFSWLDLNDQDARTAAGEAYPEALRWQCDPMVALIASMSIACGRVASSCP